MTRTAMIVELRELGHRLHRVEQALCEEERKADETFRKIMQAVMASDEAQTSSGVSGVPCSADVVWDCGPMCGNWPDDGGDEDEGSIEGGTGVHPVPGDLDSPTPCPASHDPALVAKVESCGE